MGYEELEGVTEVLGGLYLYISILVVSCFMWSASLDSSHFLLSYHIASLSSPMTCQYTNIHLYLYNNIILTKQHYVILDVFESKPICVRKSTGNSVWTVYVRISTY